MHESPVKLPRIDCAYIRVRFEYAPGPGFKHVDNISEFSSLERIASMALSYELLKKIGGHLSVHNIDRQSFVELYLPAICTS